MHRQGNVRHSFSKEDRKAQRDEGTGPWHLCQGRIRLDTSTASSSGLTPSFLPSPQLSWTGQAPHPYRERAPPRLSPRTARNLVQQKWKWGSRTPGAHAVPAAAAPPPPTSNNLPFEARTPRAQLPAPGPTHSSDSCPGCSEPESSRGLLREGVGTGLTGQGAHTATTAWDELCLAGSHRKRPRYTQELPPSHYTDGKIGLRKGW